MIEEELNYILEHDSNTAIKLVEEFKQLKVENAILREELQDSEYENTRLEGRIEEFIKDID